jgi:hypothetical protein
VRASAAGNARGNSLGRPSTSLRHHMQAALQPACTVVDVSGLCSHEGTLSHTTTTPFVLSCPDSCTCGNLFAAEPEPPPIHRHVGQLCGMASVCIPHNRPVRPGIQRAWSAHRQLHGRQLLRLCR